MRDGKQRPHYLQIEETITKIVDKINFTNLKKVREEDNLLI